MDLNLLNMHTVWLIIVISLSVIVNKLLKANRLDPIIACWNGCSRDTPFFYVLKLHLAISMSFPLFNSPISKTKAKTNRNYTPRIKIRKCLCPPPNKKFSTERCELEVNDQKHIGKLLLAQIFLYKIVQTMKLNLLKMNLMSLSDHQIYDHSEVFRGW